MAKYRIFVKTSEQNQFWIVVDNGKFIRNPNKENMTGTKLIYYNPTNICPSCIMDDNVTDRSILYPKNAYRNKKDECLCSKHYYQREYRNKYHQTNTPINLEGLQLVDKENIKTRGAFSEQKIIEKLQKWSKYNRRVPTAKDFEYETPSRMTISRHFGSWNNALEKAGFDNTNSNVFRSRIAEVQTISEFKREGTIDLSGENWHSTCDGICPKGDMFDTKSASLTLIHGRYGWKYYVSINQLIEADYIFLRAYKDKDFTIPPLYKWRVPIDFMENSHIIIYNDDITGTYNIKNMLQYKIE